MQSHLNENSSDQVVQHDDEQLRRATLRVQLTHDMHMHAYIRIPPLVLPPWVACLWPSSLPFGLRFVSAGLPSPVWCGGACCFCVCSPCCFCSCFCSCFASLPCSAYCCVHPACCLPPACCLCFCSCCASVSASLCLGACPSLCRCACLSSIVSVSLCRCACPSVSLSACPSPCRSCSRFVSLMCPKSFVQCCFLVPFSFPQCLAQGTKAQNSKDKTWHCKPRCICHMLILSSAGNIPIHPWSYDHGPVRAKKCVCKKGHTNWKVNGRTGPDAVWATMLVDPLTQSPASNGPIPSKVHRKVGTSSLAYAPLSMCRWGNLRAKGGASTQFEIYSNSNGGEEGIGPLRRTNPPRFKLCPGLSQQKQGHRKASLQTSEPRLLGTGRGKLMPQPWASGSEPGVKSAGPRCNRWRGKKK